MCALSHGNGGTTFILGFSGKRGREEGGQRRFARTDEREGAGTRERRGSMKMRSSGASWGQQGTADSGRTKKKEVQRQGRVIGTGDGVNHPDKHAAIWSVTGRRCERQAGRGRAGDHGRLDKLWLQPRRTRARRRRLGRGAAGRSVQGWAWCSGWAAVENYPVDAPMCRTGLVGGLNGRQAAPRGARVTTGGGAQWRAARRGRARLCCS